MDKAPETKQDQCGLGFAVVAGLFLFVALLKWGNPVILDAQVAPPQNFYEALYDAWPIQWAYFCFIPVVLVGLLCMPWQTLRLPASTSGKVLVWLPLAWLGWQLVAATHTVDASLTSVTVKHFSIAVALFYFGFFALGRVANPWPVWLFLTVALLWIVRVGWEQHFGGLEETRKYFYSLPNWQAAPPEFVKKLSSNRIYSTLFYPNTLAGALLLLLPITLGWVWQILAKLRARALWVITVLVAAPSLACLYWSGSKAGWLIALILVVVTLALSKVPRRIVYPTIVLVLAIGTVLFAVKNARYFEHGSTSIVARSDYWRAAITMGREHPLFGTGPGTFAKGYEKIKSPDAEMARLSHNDYLEQFSDSGIVGFTLYLCLFVGVGCLLYRYRNEKWWFVGVGLFGVFLHETMEFHLYIPAIAWPTFFLSGWIVAQCQTTKTTIS